jgi:hypothetical protein
VVLATVEAEDEDKVDDDIVASFAAPEDNEDVLSYEETRGTAMSKYGSGSQKKNHDCLLGFLLYIPAGD